MPSLLTLPSLIIAAQVRARPGPLSGRSPRSAVGEQVAHEEAAQAPAESADAHIDVALAKGDLNATRQLLEEFLAEPTLPADGLLRTGVNLAKQDLYPEPAQVFRRCVRDYPGMFEGYYNLALGERALRKYSEAVATLNKAPRTAGSEEEARTYLRGKIEVALNQNAEAEQDLAVAFAAAPQEENFALDLGLLYIRAQKYQQAAEVFRKASGFRKDSSFLQLGLALAQFPWEGRASSRLKPPRPP